MKRIVLAVAALALASAAHAAPPDPHAVLAEADRVVSDHGIDEAKAIEIGGVRQWITVRGRDRRNPILLVIHGGPAVPELPNRYLFEGPWTDYFTVVEWDQRGAGKTYELNDPAAIAPTLSRERIVQDAAELTDWLRKTYGRTKIFVIGHSWGTAVGLELARRHPDWLYAYVGVGQIIDMQAGERASYAWTMAEARQRADPEAVRELTAIAPYPEEDGSIPLAKINTERKWLVQYGGLTHNRSSFDVWENAERISPDYDEADFKAIDKGSLLSLPRLLPDLAKTDFSHVRRIDCPVIIFAGRYDETTPSGPVTAWFERLSAPSKRLVWFENSAHMMYVEEPGRVLMHLVEDARPFAVQAGDVAPEE